MQDEQVILGWYEPLVLSVRFRRTGLWCSTTSILLGAGTFAITVLAEWVFAPKCKMAFGSAALLALMAGFGLYLLLPILDLMTPVYVKLSSSHLTRTPFLGDPLDIGLGQVMKCQFFALKVLGRSYSGMWVHCSDGQEILVGLSSVPGKEPVQGMLRGAGVVTEDIKPES